MFNSIVSMLKIGIPIRKIARDLKIDRNTVRSVYKRITGGVATPPVIQRKSSLDNYEEKINELLENNYSGKQIHQELSQLYDIKISYPSVTRFLKKHKAPEAFAPMISKPGEEAQVDFGHIGRFLINDSIKLCYVFCMTLSHCRYAYYEMVTDQMTGTFIRCHINAFEFFGGVTASVKIDNLKAAVLKASFYEPAFQEEYKNFLNHYGTTGITCRIYTPEHKGKVESGVKYVKNSFFNILTDKEFAAAEDRLKDWNNNICNKRIHGTIKRIPSEAFMEEKPFLKALPSVRYDIFSVEKRKVNRYGHVAFNHSFYSVPYKFTGQEVIAKSNGRILKIYTGYEEIAVHALSGKGKFNTIENHKMEFKRLKDASYYEQKSLSIGNNTLIFFKKLHILQPSYYHRTMNGIFHLAKNYGNDIADASCKRALDYGILSYISVKRIIADGLYKTDYIKESAVLAGGFNHNLKMYDELTGGRA
ncbi:MAG: IS21 family transposase [bacterium]